MFSNHVVVVVVIVAVRYPVWLVQFSMFAVVINVVVLVAAACLNVAVVIKVVAAVAVAACFLF